VTNVSRHGLWILISAPSLRRVEKFLAFDLFPWFLDAPIGAVIDVEFQGPDHLRWPKLDIDLALDSIDHPERFPLVSRRRPIARARKTTSKSPAQVTRR
jgi:hypothetical protein